MQNDARAPKRREYVSVMGKAVVVTGAAGGIGSALARGLAEGGADVFLTDVSPEVLGLASEMAEEGLSAEAGVVDLRHDDAPQQIIREAGVSLGRIDGLVNCAGVNVVTSFEKYTREELAHVMDVVFAAPFFLCQA